MEIYRIIWFLDYGNLIRFKFLNSNPAFSACALMHQIVCLLSALTQSFQKALIKEYTVNHVEICGDSNHGLYTEYCFIQVSGHSVTCVLSES